MGEPLVQDNKLLGISLGISKQNSKAPSLFTYVNQHYEYILKALDRAKIMFYLRRCTHTQAGSENINRHH